MKRARTAEEHCALIVCTLSSHPGFDQRSAEAAVNAVSDVFERQLQQHCRRQDTVVRLAFAEFAILMPELREAFSPERLHWILDAHVKASRQAGIPVHEPVKYGLAFFPRDGETPEDLLAAAHRHLHRREQEPPLSRAAVTLKPVLVA